jgi:hypothetical protein
MGYKPHVEPIPENYFIPGDVVYDCALNYYEIRSYPLCRLYFDPNPNAKFPIQPNAFEGITPEERKAGRKANHLSYLAVLRGYNREHLVTDTSFKKVVN